MKHSITALPQTRNLASRAFTVLTVVSAQFFLFLTFFVPAARAEITNPAIGDLGRVSENAAAGTISTNYVVVLWQSIIVVGALSVLLYMVWGAVEWITAGGDSGKIQKARDKMTQAVIGMIVLASTFVIIQLISELFFAGQFDLLNPTLGGNQSATPNWEQQLRQTYPDR
jgi:hypothetical protein